MIHLTVFFAFFVIAAVIEDELPQKISTYKRVGIALIISAFIVIIAILLLTK